MAALGRTTYQPHEVTRYRAARRTRALTIGALGTATILVTAAANLLLAGDPSGPGTNAGIPPSALALDSQVPHPPPSPSLAIAAAVSPDTLPIVELPLPDPSTPVPSGGWPTAADLAEASGSVDLIYRIHTSLKVVALTFDDGWSPARGRTILNLLVKDHVPATFFVNAVYVRWAPDLWRQIARDGFPIGNHTYLHQDVTKLTPSQEIAEIRKDALVFQQLTGFTLAPLFRPPYGARTRTTDEAAALAGFPTVVVWDTSAGDTTAGVSISREIRLATQGGPGSIVLMHVGPISTPLILQGVIDAYRAKGFSFVTVPQLLSMAGS